MLAPIGGGLIMFGLCLLVLTVSRRITSDEELRESEHRLEEIKAQGGWGSGLMGGPEAWSQAAYRRPTLTRLPFQLCVVAGAILVVVDILNH